MIYNDPVAYSEPTLPVGTSYTLTSSGKWTCPATGQWRVELHGGGGGGGGSPSEGNAPHRFLGAGGGGSGQMYTISMDARTTYSYRVGSGGSAGNNGDDPTDGSKGGTTSFGSYSVAGGGGGGGYKYSVFGGYKCEAGVGAGSLGEDGDNATTGQWANAGGSGGGVGTYGDGGTGGASPGGGYGVTSPGRGKDGAIILTYLGK